jgi:hypothetical protein
MKTQKLAVTAFQPSVIQAVAPRGAAAGTMATAASGAAQRGHCVAEAGTVVPHRSQNMLGFLY